MNIINKISAFVLKFRFALIVTIIMIISHKSYSQSVNFRAKTSPSISFDFNTIQKYKTGITQYGVVELNIEANATQWDLYVGANGSWNTVSTYSTTGVTPPVDLVELRFRNTSNTQNVSGFFNLQDISTPTYVIGSSAAPDISVSCPNTGTNTSGDYLSSPNCYSFDVDMRINPDFSYQAGQYTLEIKYVIIQDL